VRRQRGHEPASRAPWLGDRLPAQPLCAAVCRTQGRGETPQAGAGSSGFRSAPPGEAAGIGIKERIAADPYASRFALSGPLRRYGRLKGLGLPDRYRLFFRPFEAEGRRLLLILWLGFPRKEGDRNDGYAVFSRLVQRGELPEDWENLQRELDAG